MDGGMPMTAQPMQPRKVCRHWANKGSCYMDASCGFLHPRDIEGVGMAGGAGGVRSAFPRTVCRHWERGNCQLDQTCGFLHPIGMQKGAASTSGGYNQWQDVERATRESYAGYSPMGMPNMGGYGSYGMGMSQMPIMGNSMMGQMGGMGYSRPPRAPMPGQGARTRVCRHWERGNCQLGDSCGFLHTASGGMASGDGGHQNEPKKSYSQNNNSGSYNSGYSQNNSSDLGNSAELTNAKLEIERLQNQLAYAENEKKKLEAQSNIPNHY
jgi:hypothetical protein